MFTIDRKKDFDKYFEKNFSLPPYLIQYIENYINIDKIDYLTEDKFVAEQQKKYLLIIKHYNDESLYKIFNTQFNYIILSNNPHNWDYLLEKKIFNGIFMNTAEIDYEKFNKKLLELQKINNNVLILDCNNVDITKINTKNLITFVVFKSLQMTLTPLYYDKIIVKCEPWTVRYLYRSKMFDKKLRDEIEKFMFKQHMKGGYDFFVIDNKNVLQKKFSKLSYIK